MPKQACGRRFQDFVLDVRRRIMCDTASYHTLYIPCIHPVYTLYTPFIAAYTPIYTVLYMYIHHMYTSKHSIYTLYNTQYTHH